MERIKKLLKEYNIVLILAVIFILAMTSVPFFKKPNNLYNLAADLSMYGIMAVGMTFVLISGEVDLSVGMSAALSMVLCAYAANKGGGFVGVLTALCVCLLISLILGLLTTKLRMSSLIASIALMTSVGGIGHLMVDTLGDGRAVALTNPFIRALYTYRLFGVRALSLPTVVFAIVLIIGGFLLRRTRFGHSVYVAGGNAEAGYMAGVNIGLVKLVCILICGLLSGITALFLTSFVYCGAVAYGEGINLTILSATVLGGTKFTGGKGGVLRTLMGIMVMRMIVNITSLLGMSAWAQNTITGVLLMLTLIIDRYSRTQREEDLV